MWIGLKDNNRLTAISGPTSSGKSFVVQNYFIESCRKKQSFKGLYIVPTKALIYEVSAAFRRRLEIEDVDVKIGFGESLDDSKKEIFVLTPERCHRLLKENTDKLKIDLIFFDEIQKMEDDERGVLLEYIINELLQSQKDSQIALAGPYLRNLEGTVMNLCGLKSPSIESQIAPVYQLKTIFRISKSKKDRIDILLKSSSGRTKITEIPIKRALYSKLKSQQTKIIAQFVNTYGRESANIIFSPTRLIAEKYAIELEKLQHETGEIAESSRVNELIDYLSNDIHPEYSLIRCLKMGIAFHHGMIPELAKLEIEELYKSNQIKNLACTTTLLEGVNLPADKIFIHRAYKRDKDHMLDDFEFGNLIGRAGRVKTNLNGSVYCIELDDDQWVKQKLDSDFRKEIIPATTKAFVQYKDQVFENLLKPSNEMTAEQAVIYTIILLRHKASRSIPELKTYLKKKGLTQNEVEIFSKRILESISDHEIPLEIVKLHPTIDPLLQDLLYKTIENEGVKKWLINKHPMYSKGLNIREISFDKKNFYRQFEEIAKKLDNIFDIQGSLVRKHGARLNNKWRIQQLENKYNIYRICFKAIDWIQQEPLKTIIRKANKKNEVGIDTIIREVIDIINNVVRFELMKYFNLLDDILRLKLVSQLDPNDPEYEEKMKSIDRKLSLHEWLEMGACTRSVISLIRSGINRSAAIAASEKIPKNFKGDPLSFLKGRLHSLDPIYQRHFKNQGF